MGKEYLNALYQAVFKVGSQRFDSNKSYYTMLMRVNETFDNFFSLLEQDLQIHVNPGSLFLVPCDNGDDEMYRAINDKRDAISDEYFGTKFSYVIVYHLDNPDQAVAKLSSIFDTIGRKKNSNDIVTLILTIPDSLEAQANISAVSKIVPAYAYTYLFTDYGSTYSHRRKKLIDCVSAAVAINSFTASRSAYKTRHAMASGKVEEYLTSLGDGRAEVVGESVPILWSSHSCKYYDRKMEFLTWYCSKLFEGIRKLDFNVINDGALAGFFNKYMPLKAGQAEVVRHAIDMIPYIAPPAKCEKRGSTLSSCFNERYGEGAEMTVELSMKSTLAKFNGTVESSIIEMCSLAIFEEFAIYYTDDLRKYIVDAIQGTRAAAELECQKHQKELKAIREREIDSGSYGEVLSEYIKTYIDAYECTRRMSFWRSVLEYIAKNPQALEEVCETNRANCKKINKVIEFYTTNPSTFNPDITIKIDSLTMGEILSLVDDSRQSVERRNVIEQIYEKCSDALGAVRIHNQIAEMINVQILPFFYDDVQFQYDSDTYSIHGYERNGKYLVYFSDGGQQ